MQPRRHFDWWTSSLIVLSGKQNKVVCGTTLKLFVGNRLVMLDIVLTNTWIVLADDLVVEAFCDFGSDRGVGLFWLLHLAGVG